MTTHLLDVNDDCLYAMFGLKYLTISDLCSVARTCTRLKAIANDIFQRKHKICKIFYLPSSRTVETKQMLCTFGSLISQLSIQTCKWIDETIMAAVIRYCSGTLKSLKFEHYGIPVDQTDGLRSLFNKLETLHMKYVYIIRNEITYEEEDFADTWQRLKTLLPSLSNFLGNSKSLVELKIIHSYDLKALVFDNTFPKLEHFKYDFCVDFIGRCKLNNFVSRHKNLKTFSLSCKEDCISLLPIIGANCTQLEKFKFSGVKYGTPVEQALMSLLTLTNLKKLKISCSSQNVTKFIQGLRSLRSLEILDLSYFRGDSQFIPALTQLKKLRVLRLKGFDFLNDLNHLGCLNELKQLVIEMYKHETVEFDVVALIQRLENLNKLRIDLHGFEIGKAKYFKIVAVAQRRLSKFQHQHTLQIQCQTESGLTDSREYRENSHIVEIES